MKNFSTTQTAIGMESLTAFNNSGERTAEKNDSSEMKYTPETFASAVFPPFKLFSITHTVTDFTTWKKSYDDHESVRQANGLTELALCRDIDNPNKVYIFLKMADVQKARDLAVDPALKEAMQKSGVNSVPAFIYADIVRFEESPTEYKDRIRIGHKVKDFDAWLTGYDAEGKVTRAANGMIDESLSRDIADPDMVYITFAISDLAKAKTRLNNSDLKKIMTEAGVEGIPVVDFYTSTD